MYAFKKSNYEANYQLNVVQRLFVHLKFGTETFRRTFKNLTSADPFNQNSEYVLNLQATFYFRVGK